MRDSHPLLFALCPISLVALTLAGCGGGSNNGGTATTSSLSGDMAAQAALVSGYQAFQSGVNYPFAQVEATLPTGSSFGAAFKAARAAAAKQRAVATAHDGSTADGIGLYTAVITSGSTATLTEYADAGETQSDGTLTITQTSPATTSLSLGTYSTYPVDFAIAANVTSGPLPITGSGTIVLADSHGAGEIKGTFRLPASSVSVSADLTLDDSGSIGGTASVVENGQTLTLTNLSGTLTGPITGTVSVAPGGDTGTATLDILNGTFSVTLHTPSGTATAANDGSGNLDITLPSGTSETLSTPLTASPTGTYTTTGGGSTGPGGGSGALQLDVPALFPFTDWQPEVSNSIPFNVLINDSNQVVEQNANTQLIYIPSVNALSTQSTIAGPGNDPIALVAFNSSGQIIANSQANTAIYSWAGPTASPTTLAYPRNGIGSSAPTGTASALSSTGQIVGSAEVGGDCQDITTSNTAEYLTTAGVSWESAQSAPTLLVGLNNSVTTTSGYTFVVCGALVQITGPAGADTYTLTGIGDTVAAPVTSRQATLPLVTDSVTPLSPGTYSGTFTATLSGSPVASFAVTLTVGDANAHATGVNRNGLVVGLSVGSNTTTPVYWPSGSQTPQALPLPGGLDPATLTALAVNDNGDIYADTSYSAGQVYVWSGPTAQPTALPFLTGGRNATATAINDSGTIVGYCFDGSGQEHAVIWKNGQITDLQPFSTPTTTVNGTIYNTLLMQATSLNDSGIVVGYADITPYALRLQ